VLYFQSTSEVSTPLSGRPSHKSIRGELGETQTSTGLGKESKK